MGTKWRRDSKCFKLRPSTQGSPTRTKPAIATRIISIFTAVKRLKVKITSHACTSKECISPFAQTLGLKSGMTKSRLAPSLARFKGRMGKKKQCRLDRVMRVHTPVAETSAYFSNDGSHVTINWRIVYLLIYMKLLVLGEAFI